jgi:hypothetical protein
MHTALLEVRVKQFPNIDEETFAARALPVEAHAARVTCARRL